MPKDQRSRAAAETIAVSEQMLAGLTDVLGEDKTPELPPLHRFPETSAEPARRRIREIITGLADGTDPYDASFRPVPPSDHLPPAYLRQEKACAQFDEDLLDALIRVADGSDETPALDPGWYTIVVDILSRGCHELSFIHLARIVRVILRGDLVNLPHALDRLVSYRVRHEEVNSEPRVLDDALHRSGFDEETVNSFIASLAMHSWPWDPADLWPWLIERPEVLETWLIGEGIDSWLMVPERALHVLTYCPHVPNRLLPLLAEKATGDSLVQRRLARQILATTPAALYLACAQLGLRTSDRRLVAVDWLSSMGDQRAVPVLREALDEERNHFVRAAEIKLLQASGEDIGAFLSPRVLTDEAREGLRGSWPKHLDWLDPAALPAARWADGTVVEPKVLAWWVTLADTMKDPDGSGLMALYLDRLDPDDAAELGRHVIDRWIEHDTRRRSTEKNRELAEISGLLTYKDWQRRAESLTPADTGCYAEEIREQAARPQQSFIDEYFRNYERSYLGSAITNKGLLALTVAMPGDELARTVQTYMSEHRQRRTQFVALLSALAANGRPGSVDLLMAIARHHSMPTVQKAAGELAGRFAEHHGWTADELADRIIPTAGLADDGLLHLDYGPRQFHGSLTAKGRLRLSGPDLKPIRSLPGPEAGDDPELVAAAKEQLSASRRELTSVMSRQPARLHEAMCLGRVWPAEAWRQSLAAHPLMRLLLARLVMAGEPRDAPAEGLPAHCRRQPRGRRRRTAHPGSRVPHRAGPRHRPRRRGRRGMASSPGGARRGTAVRPAERAGDAGRRTAGHPHGRSVRPRQ
ncbi:Uncharacterised protein [Propionibacterium australiense]|uniref:DUF4132 domain-containing protein n=1 Tax=Propionibacterium australiense TaxID=119981 RepID=A0A383S3X3_9ACTN|nr:DUF4132 domain-containing protein [Propionibacterium australiense]RLP11153.1 DUF4132 domain-containing protein [Propionibacterium australiense]RLP12482.1 DUF4132 domain-containing protein [Propionibacterium australiense]SYZ32700.1 Domain of unknown function (DUF4132) [Propionibacterium australiense]VEH91527.1 Uncharacterised protein [Propionibacterium australiense]